MSTSNDLLVLPCTHLNAVWVEGLRKPLEEVAEILDEQDHPEYARALRDAATICDAFSIINIKRTHTLQLD